MAKRRLISQLPAFNQTEELTNFFGATVDQVFQPGTSEPISGYIGRRETDAVTVFVGTISGNTLMVTSLVTGTLTINQPITGTGVIPGTIITALGTATGGLGTYIVNVTQTVPSTTITATTPTDLYVGEPTPARAAYQLEAGMVSYDTTGSLAEVLSYPDFVGYLSTTGANITDHQRLFETEYYSWAPPINIDMIVNYHDYYWFGDVNGAADLPILTLTLPMTQATGDGSTTTFNLPASIHAVPLADEDPVVFVNSVPVPFTVSGNTVVLTTAPASGAAVLVARLFSFVQTVTGDTTVDISDLNDNGVTLLSTGMRIKVIDPAYTVGGWDAQPWDFNLWDFSGSGIYMVDDIGQTVRFTPDENMQRGVIAQYVTIERSSRDANQWSLHNLWVHKDTLSWANTTYLIPLSERQALRPIVEFVHDIALWSDSGVLQSNVNTGSTTLTFTRTFPNILGRQVIGSAFAQETVVTSVQGGTITISKPTIASLLANHAITFRQLWAESIDPLFMLYDLETVAFNDPTRYPGSIFVGSRIFGYATGSSPLDGLLLRSLSFDRNDYIVFNNDSVTVSYTYTGGTITSMPMYATVDGTPTYDALWHAAETTTSQGVTNGFYDVPLNLEANPNSQDVTIISRSTWIDQFAGIIGNQEDFAGQALGSNNYRDSARDLTLGTSILQHRAPLLKAMLMASTMMFDLPDAIRYADQEYNRFRNKFARKLVDLQKANTLSGTDPASTWVTTTLNAIKRGKNNQFPFALNTIGGAQYFIPPTPTCLGIMPAAVPAMVTDTTYATSVLMILGHDGSLTPAFGDWRDPIMLALEQLIYDNLPAGFQTETRPIFDIQQWIGGRFFQPFNGYSRTEISPILAPLFELWSQQNFFDYRTNSTYDPSNPFTWNFRDVVDAAGNPLPGNWRAIYRWYYGTDAPHIRPWEMLGFIYEPTWWETQYGAPPYSRTNTGLWTDLENGTIRGGPRTGTDGDYARPGLSSYIPVDASGVLLDPVATGIVTATVNADTGSRTWLPGDQAPVENLWINSPSYRFALAIASFLMKPARFVEECWDTINIGYIGAQWVELATLRRPLNSLQFVHGEQVNSAPFVVTGISQWISDFLLSSGVTSADFGTDVRGLDVRLIHQMAGFTSNDDMQAVSDSFGLVPPEDVTITLYTSPDIRSEVYSGVILEWTGRSWRVIGYDSRSPYFTIIPPDVNGPKGVISIATAPEPVILEWHANTRYALGVLVDEFNSVWECITAHMSTQVFQQNFWKPRPDIDPHRIMAPRITSYARGLNTTQIISYGTEFYTYQQVGDFLLGWQRWLELRGWTFTTTDDNGLVLDWTLSVKEFLSWTQVQWSPGNFIALSPGQQELQFFTDTGTILNIESTINAFFGLSDRSGRPIGSRDAIINRLDGNLTIHAKNADVFAARLGFADIEHTLVFSNVTIFDDDIYLPLFNQRQARLLLICKRSRDWAGRLDAPGFVVSGNQMKSDFQKAADDVRLAFDIELSDRADLRDYARHVIGFQTRDYMQNLLLSEVEQFEFYQGMIQQKGAAGVFQKLMRSNRASNNSNLQFLEEWAIQIGAFGTPIDPFLTFQLSQIDMRDDPQIVRFVPTTNAPPDWIVLATPDVRWLDEPSNPAQFFTMNTTFVKPSLPTAGPVRLSDVAQTIFSITDAPALYLTLFQSGLLPYPTGSLTWVYERADGTYTVLRSYETSNTPNAILKVVTNAEDPLVTTTRIYFQHSIRMQPADIGCYLVIDGVSLSTPELQGLVTITGVNVAQNYVTISTVGIAGKDFTSTPADAPFVRILRETRFASMAALTAANWYTFPLNALAWIDIDTGGHWNVRQWNGHAWTIVRSQPLRPNPATISQTMIYRAGTILTKQQLIVDQPLVDEVTVIDPLSNILAGIAEREIDFATDYDPARYNAGAATITNDTWGSRQVGRVWWNLATVKFFEPFTDTIGVTNARDLAEFANRIGTWTHIAPNSRVDIYEWVQSTIDPTVYSGPGTVLNSDNPAWVEQPVYDPNLGANTILYFFWVSGLTVTPSVSFRHTDISTVALAISNPSALDLPWMAPISPDALIVSGVSQFLNDSTTVMKVQLNPDPNSPGRHTEWDLLRPNDDTSLPSAEWWQKLCDSLAGFDSKLRPIPDPRLNPLRNTGIDLRQGMFSLASTADGGVLGARRSFVDIINTIFASDPFMIDRLTFFNTLLRSTPLDPHLIWSQIDTSYVYEPPPSNEWDIEVFAIDQRNLLLATDRFHQARLSSTALRVLVNGYNNPLKQWSIWEFDPAVATALVTDNPSDNEAELLVTNANQVFTLATAYEFVVDSLAARVALADTGGYGAGSYGGGEYGIGDGTTLNVGDRVLVSNDTDFWSIWKYLPSDPTADSSGYVLWRVQTYRTDDFVNQVDWYMTGFSPANPPIIDYATVSARDATEGALPTNLFVQIDDDGSGHWIWTQFKGGWVTVAIEGGTIALSDALHTAGPVHGAYVWQATTVSATLGATVLQFADTTGIQVGQFVIGNPNTFNRSTHVVSVTPTSVTLGTATTAAVPQGTFLAFTTLSLDDVATRDGSWEIDVLAQALRYGGIMDDGQINDIFFNILNFVHVQQDSVDWAFKTSFMTIVGYNVPLRQTPVLPSDQTDSLIDYVNEVKPYRVKIRTIQTQYNTDADVADVNIPVETYDFDITMVFDRYAYDAWDIVPWDTDLWDSGDGNLGTVFVHTVVSTSLLTPGPTVQVDDVRFISSVYVDDVLVPVSSDSPLTIKLGTHTYQIESVVQDTVNISATTNGVSGKLTTVSGNITTADATVGHTVEAVLSVSDSAMRIFNTYQPTAGMPPLDIALLLSLVPFPYPSVLNYTLTQDAIAGATILHVNTVSQIVIGQPVFGPNIVVGTTVSSTTSTTITLNQPLVNGLVTNAVIAIALPSLITGSGLTTSVLPYEYSGGVEPLGTLALSLNPPSDSRPYGYDLREPYANGQPEERVVIASNDSLHITVVANPEGGAPTQATKQFDVSAITDPTVTLYYGLIAQSREAVLVYRDGVRAQIDADYTVDHLGASVTVNLSSTDQVVVHAFGFGGASFSATDYRAFAGNPVTLDAATTTGNAAVVVNGTLLSSGYSVSGQSLTLTSAPATGTDVAVAVFTSGASNATNISVQTLAYNGGQTWTLSPHDTLTSPEINGTIVEVNGLRLTPTTDYTLSGGTLHITATMSPSDTTVATLFTNATTMGIVTNVFTTGAGPFTVAIPFDKHYAMVWMNGLLISPDIDYQIVPGVSNATLTITTPTSGHIVAMMFTLHPASDTIQWMINSRVPTAIRMPPALDNTGAQISAAPTHGSAPSQPVYQVLDEYLLNSPLLAGTLTSDLAPDATEIALDLFLENAAPKLLPENPLTIPGRSPGSIWLGSERIEYFGYARSGNSVTLSQLRRATRGTSSTEQRQVAILTGTGSPQSTTFTGTGDAEVMINGVGVDNVTINVSGGNTTLTVTAASGAFVVMALTTGYVYPSGMIAYNGDTVFAPPVPLEDVT